MGAHSSARSRQRNADGQSMRLHIKRFAWSLILLAAVGGVLANEATESPRLLVHLLDYLAKDYGGAVVDGRVVNETEYREQIEFAREAVAMSTRLAETRDHRDIVEGIETLQGLIEHQLEPSDVAMFARQLELRVVDVSGIALAPDGWPNLARGGKLYRSNCIACHGERGFGDGPASAALKPRPANFLSEDIGSNITPFRAFNSIRVGVPGTGMAPWPAFSDRDAWDLAFYVTSLHVDPSSPRGTVSPDDLATAATQSDRELLLSLIGSLSDRRARIAALRLYSSDSAGTLSQPRPSEGANALATARSYLAQAEAAYARQDFDLAKRTAVLAYLEGVEPVEPRLRANDVAFVTEFEQKMAAVRSAIDARVSAVELEALNAAANRMIDAAEQRLAQPTAGPWVTFVLTAGILLREGFEAVLILIALLAVIRASGATRASWWVHGGWAAALGAGLLAWFFSGWVLVFSGAQREMLEGVTGLLAVAVLLYIGFWLHSRTEITRWRQFVEVQVMGMLKGGNLWGLAAIAFMAVFREAFETVLFMRAITLEGGATSVRAMALGVGASLVALFVLSWLLLKYSAKLPIRRIFTVSSALMVVLAVILAGKGLHAIQETGALAVTPTPWAWSSDVLGIYATWQTLFAQIVTVGLVIALWRLGSRPANRQPTS